jgi:hypothetical protein
MPSIIWSSVEGYEGRDYVVLRNINGVLGVYRIRSNGSLGRLKNNYVFAE